MFGRRAGIAAAAHVENSDFVPLQENLEKLVECMSLTDSRTVVAAVRN
ncbi:hypothetical protein [Rhodococcus sp. NPDC127528]